MQSSQRQNSSCARASDKEFNKVCTIQRPERNLDDLKKIYGAVNLDDAEYTLEEFSHLIYITNEVEAYHRMVRKFTKSKCIFPTDDAIRKVVYL
ncbi:MAG: hypothetical protein LBQ71_13315 [Hungatella sp.]|jgi:hypothetical protein|nr:hypothetical protein [Hungatella sp.]